MPVFWVINIIALWVMVLLETALLIMLLRALGRLRQEGGFSGGRVADRVSGGLPVGIEAPIIPLSDYDGHSLYLEDTKGHTRIITFINPGCEACAGAITALNNLLAQRQDLSVYLVGGPNRETNRAYAAEHQSKIPVLTSNPGRGREVYRVEGVPFTFVIDGAGIIRAAGVINDDDHLQMLLSRAEGTPNVSAA